MAYLAGLVGLLLVLTAEARIGSSSESEVCTTETQECMLYDVVCKNDDYEVRHYESVQWVSTKESSLFMEFGTATAFRRVYKYITGSNENGIQIEMTAPVIIKIGKTVGYNEYALSFLLPSDHQKNPPKPTDDRVYISAMPDMKVYVGSYGAWILTLSETIESNRLKGQLDVRKAQYLQDYRYAVGYNSPMTLLNRHNEVWYVVEGEPVC